MEIATERYSKSVTPCSWAPRSRSSSLQERTVVVDRFDARVVLQLGQLDLLEDRVRIGTGHESTSVRRYRLDSGEALRPEAVNVSGGRARELAGELPPHLFLLRPGFRFERFQQLLACGRSLEQLIDAGVTGVSTHEQLGPACAFVPVVEDGPIAQRRHDDSSGMNQER